MDLKLDMQYINIYSINQISIPLMILLATVCLFVLFQLFINPKTSSKWVLFVLFCYFASLTKYGDSTQSPDLAFPLQQLRDHGRAITAVLMVLLACAALIASRISRTVTISKPIVWLLCFQLVIVFKTIVSESSDYGVSLLAAVLLLGFFHTMGISKWLKAPGGYDSAIKVLVGISFIFITTNIYQVVMDRHAVTFLHGNFSGTTGNPHHAAALLGSTIPAYLYLLAVYKKKHVVRNFFLITFLSISVLALLWTSSRNGLLATSVSMLYFFRNRLGVLFKILLIAGFLLVIYLGFFRGEDFNLTTLLEPVQQKITQGQNTRTAEWQMMWAEFKRYPIYGAPISDVGRVAYGTSSWLAALSAAGLFGLIPIVLFLGSVFSLLVMLRRVSAGGGLIKIKSDVVISGLLFFLVSSIFEALLLGVITPSVNIFFLYCGLGLSVIRERFLIDKKNGSYN